MGTSKEHTICRMWKSSTAFKYYLQGIRAVASYLAILQKYFDCKQAFNQPLGSYDFRSEPVKGIEFFSGLVPGFTIWLLCFQGCYMQNPHNFCQIVRPFTGMLIHIHTDLICSKTLVLRDTSEHWKHLQCKTLLYTNYNMFFKGWLCEHRDICWQLQTSSPRLGALPAQKQRWKA